MSNQEATSAIKLPKRLVTSVDLSRSLRELKNLDDSLNQAAIRAPGTSVSLPKTSATLEELATANNVSLLDKNQREQLVGVLSAFSVHAPRIHMSFAVEPSAQFLDKMITWLRANINPVLLLEVGLQPTLAAGCTVRTQNKIFDLSLRNRFIEQRQKLIESIEAVAAPAVAQQPTAATATVSTGAAPPSAPQAPVAAQPAVPPSTPPAQAKTEQPV